MKQVWSEAHKNKKKPSCLATKTKKSRPSGDPIPFLNSMSTVYVQGKTGWAPAKTTGKPKKGKLSGAQRRKRNGLCYGSAAYASAKYGQHPVDAEARAQRTFNSTRPDRKRGPKRCR